MTKFDKKVSDFGVKYGICYKYQQLKYGFSRVVITPEDKNQHIEILKAVKRLKNIHISEWIAPSNIWEGIIYLMDADDYKALIEKGNLARKYQYGFWLAEHVFMQAGKTREEAARLADAIFGTREN